MSRFSRRTFMSAAAASSAASASVQNKSRKQPNVIVFFTDQQRWDSVGAYGGPMGLTPNLDRFARQGVRFEHAFTSQPVCGPARSTLQTGRYPTSTGVVHNGINLKDNETTLATEFKRAGYQTGYVGKWHLGGSGKAPVPVERRGGYDEFWAASDLLEFTSGAHEGTVFDKDNNPLRFSGKYRADFLTDLGLQFLRQRQQKPFFLFISYLEPHHQNNLNAFVAPEGYAERYKNNFYVPPDLAPYPGDWKSQLPNYYGAIARLDECFGRLLDELKAQSLEEDTIVLFTTDHGCHFRTRNSEYKRSCHESSIRIPMVARGPGFDRGRVVEEFMSLVDVPPTLLDAAGIPVPKTMQGRSAVELARGNAANWRNEAFVQLREAELGRVLRTERWKYSIFDPTNTDRNAPHSQTYTERYFYDLRSDPSEHVNLIGRKDYRDIADELSKRLLARMREVGEPNAKISPARFYA